jgi:hypothetical protein
VGVNFVSLSVFWDELETAPGIFDPDPNWLEIANRFYSTEGVAVALVVSPIDTNVLRVPADLEGTPFDDPAIIERYLATLDYALGQLRDVALASISIGNEVDAYLSSHPDEWQEYCVLYERALQHLHANAPNVPVGVKATFDGLTGDAAEELLQLNSHSDAIFATYYPLKRDFTVEDPAVFETDIANLLGRYPRRPVYLLEVGYPSSPALGSSEEKQAEFVRQVFTTWDRHRQHIPLLNFTWMHDISQESLGEYATYYGLSDHRFLAFLGSLGLRTNDGHDKPAFDALRNETGSRSW